MFWCKFSKYLYSRPGLGLGLAFLTAPLPTTGKVHPYPLRRGRQAGWRRHWDLPAGEGSRHLPAASGALLPHLLSDDVRRSPRPQEWVIRNGTCPGARGEFSRDVGVQRFKPCKWWECVHEQCGRHSGGQPVNLVSTYLISSVAFISGADWPFVASRWRTD